MPLFKVSMYHHETLSPCHGKSPSSKHGVPSLPHAMVAMKERRKKNIPGLVNRQKTIEKGHRNSGFAHY
jgi:hypothetical protein